MIGREGVRGGPAGFLPWGDSFGVDLWLRVKVPGAGNGTFFAPLGFPQAMDGKFAGKKILQRNHLVMDAVRRPSHWFPAETSDAGCAVMTHAKPEKAWADPAKW